MTPVMTNLRQGPAWPKPARRKNGRHPHEPKPKPRQSALYRPLPCSGPRPFSTLPLPMHPAPPRPPHSPARPLAPQAPAPPRSAIAELKLSWSKTQVRDKLPLRRGHGTAMLESCSETGAQSLPFCAIRIGFDSKCNLCASLEHKTIRCAFRVHFIVIPNADQGLPRHLAAPPFQFSFWFLLTVSLVCFCQYACLCKPSPPKTFSPKMQSAMKCAYFVTNEAYVAWRRAD